MWKYDGTRRPSFADNPGPGQESVWDYPRPPALRQDSRDVRVRCGDVEVAATTRALRVCETASPPTFYLPLEDVHAELLRPAAGRSYCEWKGAAAYFDLVTPAGVVEQAGWTYPRPTAQFAALAGYAAFYPARVACFVEGEQVQPQPGGFYGGWLTSDIAGPVKGEAGTHGW